MREIKDRIMEIVVANKEDLLYSAYRRRETSTNNKDLHTFFIRALEEGFVESLTELIFYSQYFHKPFKGVWLCSRLSTEVKRELYDLTEEYNDKLAGE